MKLEIHRAKQKEYILSIQEFAERYDLTMQINERAKPYPNNNKKYRFYAKFNHIEILDGNMLKSFYGNGENPRDAILNYIVEIVGQKAIYKAGSEERKEIQIPKQLIYDESFNDKLIFEDLENEE